MARANAARSLSPFEYVNRFSHKHYLTCFGFWFALLLKEPRLGRANQSRPGRSRPVSVVLSGYASPATTFQSAGMTPTLISTAIHPDRSQANSLRTCCSP
jgi:hypothetical protein